MSYVLRAWCCCQRDNCASRQQRQPVLTLNVPRTTCTSSSFLMGTERTCSTQHTGSHGHAQCLPHAVIEAATAPLSLYPLGSCCRLSQPLFRHTSCSATPAQSDQHGCTVEPTKPTSTAVRCGLCCCGLAAAGCADAYVVLLAQLRRESCAHQLAPLAGGGGEVSLQQERMRDTSTTVEHDMI